jgi:hypothetical protein
MQVLMNLVQYDGVIEHDAAITQGLPDLIREPLGINRRFTRHCTCFIGHLPPALSRICAPSIGSRGETLPILVSYPAANGSLQSLDRQQRVGQQSQIGGKLHCRNSALRGIHIHDRHIGIVGRLVWPDQPRNISIKRQNGVCSAQVSKALIKRVGHGKAVISPFAGLRYRDAE